MPRIRSLKPEFWGHPDPPCRDARLLYQAMWNWADDYGIGDANPKALAGFAFPYDEDIDGPRVEELFAEIAASYDVVFYTVGGRRYYACQSWTQHQLVKNPGKRNKPGPQLAESFLYQPVSLKLVHSTPGSTPESPPGSGPESGELEVSSSEVSSSEVSNAVAANAATAPQTGGVPNSSRAKSLRKSGTELGDEKPKRATRLPEDWLPPRDVVDAMKARFPHPDSWWHTEHEKFCNYWHAKSGQQATKLDWPATWRNWIIKAAEEIPRRNGHPVNATTNTVGWMARRGEHP